MFGKGTMSRSRSFNRFHRFLARQKRRSQRMMVSNPRQKDEMQNQTMDYSRELLAKLCYREIEMELLEN